MRLLLLETLHTESLRQHRVEFFPFFVGLADELGMETAWWVLPVAQEAAHAGRRFQHDIAPETRGALAARLGALDPDVIVTHDRLAPAALDAVRAAAPGARLVDLTDPTPEPSITLGEARALLTGDPGPEDDAERYFTDRVMPRVCRELPFPLGFSPDVQPHRLLVERHCRYRRPLKTNRWFAGMDEPLVCEHRGCSFCEAAMLCAPEGPAYEVDPVARALRQIRAHEEGSDAATFRYVAEEGVLTDLVDLFLEAVIEAGARPSEFVMMTRVDTLLARRDRLEALLPRLAEHGHRLTLVSLGGENFSEDENERLNKGITRKQLWACFEMLEDLLARFPTALSVRDQGFFASILFTPWTRPADLRANVVAARRLGAGWLQRTVGTRLQLWDTLPITALARRDGLLVERFGAPGALEAVCINNPDLQERPWRFADPRAETLCALLPRLDEVPQQARFGQDDPLYVRTQSTRAGLVAELRDDFVKLAEATIDAVEALEENAGPEAALDRLARRFPAPAEPEAPAGDSEGRPVLVFTLGDQRLYLAEHVPGRPCVERVGELAIWHDESRLEESAARFARLLASALARPRLAQADLADLELWQRVAAALGEKAGGVRVRVTGSDGHSHGHG